MTQAMLLSQDGPSHGLFVPLFLPLFLHNQPWMKLVVLNMVKPSDMVVFIESEIGYKIWKASSLD